MRKVFLIGVLLSCLSLQSVEKEYFSTIEYPIREVNRERMSYSDKS